jgi:hypothetical protein
LSVMQIHMNRDQTIRSCWWKLLVTFAALLYTKAQTRPLIDLAKPKLSPDHRWEVEKNRAYGTPTSS